MRAELAELKTRSRFRPEIPRRRLKLALLAELVELCGAQTESGRLVQELIADLERIGGGE